MHRFIALAVYACKVAGTPTESIDFRVRVLDAASLEDAKQSLEAEPTGQYRNGDGEVVEWPLALILDIQALSQNVGSGTEVAGAITSLEEIGSNLPRAPTD